MSKQKKHQLDCEWNPGFGYVVRRRDTQEVWVPLGTGSWQPEASLEGRIPKKDYAMTRKQINGIFGDSINQHIFEINFQDN